jgi:CrcB protein
MLDTLARFLANPFTLLLVGGGLGTNARYWLGVWFAARGWSAHFPWHTFGINVAGSFLLGVVAVACRDEDRRTWFLLLGTGFCGGFTTFSTFSVETLEMLQKDRAAAAVAYVLGSVLAGLFGAWAGVKLIK